MERSGNSSWGRRVKYLIASSILVVHSFAAKAEEVVMSDLDGVRAAVFDYYYGVVDSDKARLRRAFDASVAHLIFPPQPVRDSDQSRLEKIEDSFERWVAAAKGQTEGEIVTVDIIDGKLASVKFRFLIWDTDYLDLLTLYKTEGSWKIVNKTFIVR